MEKLNPWKIEIDWHTREQIRINIVSETTGEIRQITLNVDDIAAIGLLEKQRILKAAEIVDDDAEEKQKLDTLLNYISDESWED